MRLYLVRHGEAADNSERALNAEGIHQAERTAEWAKGKGIKPVQIRHSGKRRAAQTAEIIGKRIAPEKGILRVSGLLPDDDVEPTLNDLEAEGLSSIMLVGHNPFLGVLVHRLLSQSPGSPSVTFQTGTIACLVQSPSGWMLTDTFTPSGNPS